MATRNLYVRVAVQDLDTAAAALRKFGNEGDEALKRIENARQRTSHAARATQKELGDSAGLARHELINLSRQVQDVGVSLASGQSPLIILAQQGTQIGDIFASTRGTMGGFFGQVASGARAMISPVALATASVIALGAAAGVVLARAGDIGAESRAMGVALRAMGRDAEISTRQVHQLVEAMRDLGVGRSDAREAVLGAIRTRGASGADIARAAGMAPDFAAALGVSVQDATKKLAEMGAQGYGAIKKLDDAYGFLSASELRQIRLLAEQGEQAKALDIAYAALSRTVGGAAKDSLSEAAKLWHDVGRGVTGLIDSVANSEPVLYVLKSWVWALNGLRGVDTLGSLQRELADSTSKLAALHAVREGLSGKSGKAADTMREANYQAIEAEIARRAAIEKRVREFANPTGTGPGATPGGAPAGAAAPGGGDGSAGRKYLDEQTDAIRRQNETLRASAAVRELVRARLAAETEARDRNLDKAQTEELVALRVGEAKAKLAAAARDASDAMALEVKGALAIAGAYGQSEAAGKAMEARVRAQADALRNGAIDVEKQTQAYRDLAAAQGLIDVTREAAAMRNAADAAAAATAAARDGVEASQEAARQADVEAVKRKALAAATDATRAAVESQVAAYDAESRRRLEATQQLERETRLRQAQQAAIVAAMQAEAAAIGDPDLARAAQLRIERQIKINELVARYGDIAHQAAQAELALWDKSQASREVVRFWQDVRSRAETISQDVAEFLRDGFVSAAEGGRSAFDNLWEGALAGGKRFLIALQTEILRQKIILPITTALVNSTPNLFGISQPGGSGGGVDVFDLLGAGKNVVDIAGKFSGTAAAGAAGAAGLAGIAAPAASSIAGVGALGTATSLGVGAEAVLAGAGLAGTASSGIAGAASLGALTAPVAALAAAGGSFAAIGATLAAAAPYLAVAAVALPLIMNLFKGTPSVGQNLISTFALSGTDWGVATNPAQQVVGKYFQGYAATDNAGPDMAAVVKAQTQAFVDSIDAFIDQFGITLTERARDPGIVESLTATISNFLNPKEGNSGDRAKGFQTEIAGFLSQKGLSSLSEATADVVRQVLVKGFELGALEAEEPIRRAIARSTATTMEQLVADVMAPGLFMQGLKDVVTAAGPNGQAILQVRGLADAYKANVAQAELYGYGEEGAAAALAAFRAQLEPIVKSLEVADLASVFDAVGRGMPELLGAFGEIAVDMQAAAAAQQQAAGVRFSTEQLMNDAAAMLMQAATGLLEYQQSLLTGPLSALSPGAQFGEVERQFRALLPQVNQVGPDMPTSVSSIGPDQAAAIQAAVPGFLAAAQAYYGGTSTAGYGQAFALAQAGLAAGGAGLRASLPGSSLLADPSLGFVPLETLLGLQASTAAAQGLNVPRFSSGDLYRSLNGRLPGFATGGSFSVPAGAGEVVPLIGVHGGETVRVSGGANDPVVVELRALRAELRELRRERRDDGDLARIASDGGARIAAAGGRGMR